MFNKNKITIVINTESSSLINVIPKTFNNSKLIAKELLRGNAVVVDLQEIKSVEAIRFIDFLTGVLFTTGGAFKKLSSKTYLLAPSQKILDKFLTQFE